MALFDHEALSSQKFSEIEPVLKAMRKNFGEFSPAKETLFKFYQGLALRNHEELLVRRQAMKNLPAWVRTELYASPSWRK